MRHYRSHCIANSICTVNLLERDIQMYITNISYGNILSWRISECNILEFDVSCYLVRFQSCHRTTVNLGNLHLNVQSKPLKQTLHLNLIGESRPKPRYCNIYERLLKSITTIKRGHRLLADTLSMRFQMVCAAARAVAMFSKYGAAVPRA